MRLLVVLVLFLFSCQSKTKKGIEGNNNDNNTIVVAEKKGTNTGIEGDNNSNNTVIIADKVEIPNMEEKKYKTNYDITTEGVGGIKIGQSIDEVQQFFKKNTKYIFKIDEGARGEPTDFSFPSIYVLDSNKVPLFAIRSNDLKTVGGFEVYSPLYKTYNGVHVGMSVKEFSEIYQDLLILDTDYITERDYFSPFDLNGKMATTLIFVNASNEESILKPSTDYGKESNYLKKGKISVIKIFGH